MPFAHDFLNDIDLHGNQLIDSLAEQLSAEPSGKADGYWYYNTTTSSFQFKQNGSYLSFGISDLQSDLTPTLGGDLDTDEHAILESLGTDIASQTTLTLPGDGQFYRVTGTTEIQGINTEHVGIQIELHFIGALQLTHNGTSFILPSASNITTAAGDIARFREISAGNWKCTGYTRADGTSLVGGGGSSLPFDDDVAHIANSGDATKQVRFDASEIASGNTRILQLQDGDSRASLFVMERILVAVGTELENATQYSFGCAGADLTIVSITASVAGEGTGDASLDLQKNGSNTGDNLPITTASNGSDFDRYGHAEIKRSFLAADELGMVVTADGSGGSGGAAASGLLLVKLVGYYHAL